MKPTIFIGSSSESKSIAEAIELKLTSAGITELWTTAFRPGYSTLEELLEKAASADFAVFVLGRDDVVTSRNEVTASPRDNVIYEAGVFTARLGPRKVFLVVDAKGTKLPSDWFGIGHLNYDTELGSDQRAVNTATIRIREQIKALTGAKESTSHGQIAGHWWQYVVSVNEGTALSLLKIEAQNDKHAVAVQGDAWAVDGRPLAKFWSRAAALDSTSMCLSYFWEGRHPYDGATPEFFGVGEVRFEPRVSGALQRGNGWYTSSLKNALQDTCQKGVHFRRADDSDVNIMMGDDFAEKSRVINDRLATRGELLGQ